MPRLTTLEFHFIKPCSLSTSRSLSILVFSYFLRHVCISYLLDVMEGGKRPNKRKGNGYLDQFEAIKKQRLGDAVAVNVKLKETAVENVTIKEENADEYFDRIFSKATTADVLSEYFWFLKQTPILLNNEMSEVLNDVKSNLRIPDMKGGKVGEYKGIHFITSSSFLCSFFSTFIPS